MASPVRIYLSALSAENEWQHFVFREIALLREHWEQSQSFLQLSIIHVGYDRPEYITEDLLEVVSDVDRPVFLTEAARWGLPSLFSDCAENPVSNCILHNRIDACPVYLIKRGWGYEIEGYETEFSAMPKKVPVASKVLRVELSGWLKILSDIKPELAAMLLRAGIYSEEEYLSIRDALNIEFRDQIDNFRFEQILPSTDTSDPFALLAIVPYWLLNVEVKRLDFTVRLQNVFFNENIVVVGDLTTLSASHLMRVQNFGRKSLADLANGLLVAYEQRDHFMETEESLISQNLFSHLQETISALPDKAKAIVSARLGTDGSRPLSLQELGDVLGVTRERIRQIEKKYLLKIAEKAVWLDVLKNKLDTLTYDRAEPLLVSMLEIEDPWFAGFADKLAYLATIISRLGKGHAGVIRFEDQFIICKLDQEQFDRMINELRQFLSESVASTPAKTEMREYIRLKCLGYGVPEFNEMIWSALSEDLHFAQRGENTEILVGIGRSVEHRIAVVLEEAEHPLHYSIIHEKIVTQSNKIIDIRRVQSGLKASPQAYLFGRGTYGLERHLPFDKEQVAEILQLAEEVIFEFAEQRQWHTVEIVRMLCERQCDFIEDLSEYNLSIILTYSQKLVSLGRLVWVSKYQDNLSSSDRIHIEDALLSILEREGCPLTAQELTVRISAYRVTRSTIQIHPTKDLVRILPRTWGLAKRDLPISRDECSRLLDGLYEHLLATQTGVHLSELMPLFKSMSESAFMEFDPYFFLSLCSIESRFRVSPGHLIGLFDWEGPRRHSFSSGFQFVLDQMHTAFPAEKIQEMLETVLGRKADKRIISGALSRSAVFDRDSGRWSKPNFNSSLEEPDEINDVQSDREDESRRVSSAY